MKYKMNKKGIASLIIVVIIGGLALLGIFSGWFAGWKLTKTITSVPSWVWWLLIFIIIIRLIGGKKK